MIEHFDDLNEDHKELNVKANDLTRDNRNLQVNLDNEKKKNEEMASKIKKLSGDLLALMQERDDLRKKVLENSDFAREMLDFKNQ